MTRGATPRGRLLAIGGAEDPDEDDLRILPRFAEMVGGRRARIVVCSAPSAEPEETARSYRKVFQRIGVAEVFEMPVTGRPEADAAANLEAVERATGVLLTGGDQLRLTSLVAGTDLGHRIRQRLLDGKISVAGTSAGAAAMGSTMIVGGPDGGSVRRADVDLAPGLGYWPDTVIDTHFNQRGRVSRLLTVFAQNPQVLGIGLDEDTAIELEPGRRFRVIGRGVATVMDGRVSHSNAPDAGIREMLAVADARVHVFPEGYGYDLRTWRPLLPDGTEVAPRG